MEIVTKKEINSYALFFMCYAPKVYSGLDKFNLVLAKKLVNKGITPVFVFCDTMKWQPAIRIDLERNDAIVEIIPSQNYLKLSCAIFRLYKQYHPVFVHAHFINYLKLITCFLSLCFRNKHFTTFHSMIYSDTYKEYRNAKGLLKSYLLRCFFRFLEQKSDMIFVISKMIEKQFDDFLGYKSKKVQLLYLGINILVSSKAKTDVRRKLKIPEGSIVLLNISAKEHIKGIDLILQALSRLIVKFPDKNIVLLHIGGLRSDSQFNKNYEVYLNDLARQLKLENNVMWLGIRNDIADIMPAVDIYVHPSLQEGLGMVNMEAAVESIPLIGSNVGGIPEVIMNGSNGFLFEVGNIEQLVEKISQLIDDDALRERMGKQSREILIERFNVDVQADKLLNYYLQ